MNRKYVYGLLLAPILIFGILALAMPTFRTEFVHNVKSMLGFPPPEYGDGSKGLRSERPEEYGGGYASPDEDVTEPEESEAEEASDADTMDSGGAEEGTTASTEEQTEEVEPAAAE